MGFRINRGIFQYKKDDGTFANKFMLDKDSGRIMEVDEGGNMTDGYLKLGEKASDSDKLDGINSSQFLRGDIADTKSGDLTIDNGRLIVKNSAATGGGSFDPTVLAYGAREQAYGRAQLLLASGYSDITIGSSQANNNHGSTLTFATVNPSNNSDYKKFVINQGNWGSRAGHLDFGYDAGSESKNPHSYIYSGDVVFTIDADDNRVGVNSMNPTHALDVNGNAHISSTLEVDDRVYADNGLHVRGDWLRVNGNNGIYFESHGGGWQMTDSTWIKAHNNKGIYTAGDIRTDSKLYVGSTDFLDSGRLKGLVNTLGSTSLPYYAHIIINGDPNTFYPVHIRGGDQNVWRRIIIKRNYSEQAPPDWNTATHKGGLLLDWEGNFGGWGGARYSDRIRVFEEQYSNMVADMYRTTHSMGYTFFLRGGGDTGASYHIHSDQAINGRTAGQPDIAYDSNFLFYDHSNNGYDYYAPEPLRLDQINTARLNGLKTLKRSQMDSLYQPVGNYITRGSTQDPSGWTNATKFKSSGQIADADSGSHSLQLISDNNNDAFMSLHVSGDYAVFFGLDGATNRLHTGGWSAGATSYQIWDSRDFGQGNINNWNTAYNWGNHAGLYDTAGTADVVNDRITENIVPTITAAQNAANAAQSTADDALAEGLKAIQVAAAAQETADGKLGATAKAADSEKVDGINGASLLRSDANDTFTGTLTSTKNGTAIQMDGGASAEGIRVKADSTTTYPVFLRSVAASNGETSPWIYKENNTAWGIWHNNPVNSFDFTRSSNNLGIENNVGGQTNSVMIRLNNTDGSGIFKGSVTASYFYGKSSDSDKLDGINSTDFIRENQDRRYKVLRFTGESGDSGNGVINYGIYQEGGAWSHPYPDLVVGYHTGVKIGGYKSYGGVRIYSDAPGRSGANKVASFAEGDENVRIVNNLHIGSAGGWITDLLNGKETAGEAQAVQDNLDGLSGSLGSLALEDSVTISEVTGLQTALDGKLSTTGKAVNSHAADGVNIVGYGTNEFSFYQTSGTFAGFTGWANYFIGNHGSGSSYYNTTHIMPFWGPPQYSRLEGGTFRGPYTYWTTENFDPASKLGATAKAADANKLDGYDWMQSGKSVRANEFYADNWFRNYNSGEGLFNQATSQHWYSDGDDYWNIAGGTSFNAIRFRDEHGGTQRGLVGADNSNRIGFLDAGGSWAVRHDNDSGTLFYTDNETLEFRVGRDKVTGNYGTVQTDTTRGGWGGYSIAGKYVFMSDHSSTAGIFNDIDNEWMAIFRRNAEVELMYNGAMKLETKSNGVAVTGEVSAASFVGNGSGLTGVSAPIPFTTVTGEATACVSMNFDGRAMVFIMADGTSYSIDGARPNQ